MAACCLLSSGLRGAVAASLRLPPRASCCPSAGLRGAAAASLRLPPRASCCPSAGLRGAAAASWCPSSGRGLRLMSAAAEGGRRPMIEESTAEYEFVERLIPPTQVPAPPPHDGPTPSGWCPPAASPPDLPYMVRRSRMHNVPVYRDTTHGNRHMTVLRKVQGDIWALERDVRQHLRELTGRELPTQVNELTMTIKVKGHFDQELKDWLLKKGF